MVEERNRGIEIPPLDDDCPICKDTFTVPCRTSCGHWYCGGCILNYWNYIGDLQPCRCPMCCQRINRLTPEKSLHLRQEEEITKVLKNVQKYNHLFVGDTHGLILKVLDLLLFITRMLQDMMITDRDDGYLRKACLFTLLLSILYKINIFEPIPLGFVGIRRMFDCYSVAVAVDLAIVLLVGIYRIRRLRHRVRSRVRLLTA
ncbi:hypothetical protein F0562_020292 [Nyssa sinensis]|uniref:RING-type domain-containing protein n=1 Tax=Nyssa sinensis TaxID=561372 RepID=A0A5J5BRJ0_9ASTE|nr:hypothetical protein F0562_020292 [Nyssa sinensis]